MALACRSRAACRDESSQRLPEREKASVRVGRQPQLCHLISQRSAGEPSSRTVRRSCPLALSLGLCRASASQDWNSSLVPRVGSLLVGLEWSW